MIKLRLWLIEEKSQILKTTMKKLSAKYGIVLSQHELALKDDVVFIPHRFFFLL